MTTEPTGYDVLDQYRAISKLKKRFLRKPNESEASGQFTALSQQCESQNLPEYAALSWIAAARCEGTLGNSINETSYLLRAARQFLKSEEEDKMIGCESGSEKVQAGLACYGHAISRYAEESSIPLGINLEILRFLGKLGRTDCFGYINVVRQLAKDKQDAYVQCLQLLACHFISIGDYVSALNSYQELFLKLQHIPKNGHTCELLLECEINVVFLLLILRPNPQNISGDLAKILEKYTWGDQNDSSLQECRMSQELFLLIQSLVFICQSVDSNGLQEIEGEFWPFLDVQQRDLLRILVKTYYP